MLPTKCTNVSTAVRASANAGPAQRGPDDAEAMADNVVFYADILNICYFATHLYRSLYPNCFGEYCVTNHRLPL